ncbi:hypothetical protein D915_004487 [Fasciola hepatica]|uniref:Uncharacterized protein n=1 Tax=Fasciola hepatica TaxID=6192 RepID=A0A4E0RDP3_FASHE|nr:hypothetical protein D915_004487 [Fasciola hepatica]
MDSYDREAPSAPPPPQYPSHGVRQEAFVRSSMAHLETLTGVSRTPSVHAAASGVQTKSSSTQAQHTHRLSASPMIPKSDSSCRRYSPNSLIAGAWSEASNGSSPRLSRPNEAGTSCGRPFHPDPHSFWPDTHPKYTPLLSRLLAPGFASAVTGSESAVASRNVITFNGSTTPVISQPCCYTDWEVSNPASAEPPLPTNSSTPKQHTKPRSSQDYRPDPEQASDTPYGEPSGKDSGAGRDLICPAEKPTSVRSLLQSRRRATTKTSARAGPDSLQLQSSSSQHHDSSNGPPCVSGSQDKFTRRNRVTVANSMLEPVSIVDEVTQQYTSTEEEDRDVLPECSTGDDEGEAQLKDDDDDDQGEEEEEEGENETGDDRARMLEEMQEQEEEQVIVMEEEEEQQEQPEDGENDNEVHFPSSRLISLYPGMLHLVSHEYVNDTAAEALVSMQGHMGMSEDDEVGAEQDETDRPEELETAADNDQHFCFFDSRGNRAPNGAHSQHSTHNHQGVHTNTVYPNDDMDEPVPVALHPKRHSMSRVARTRSQPNVLRDYVNLPDASFVHWLTTTVAAAPYASSGLAGSHFVRPHLACSTFTHLSPGVIGPSCVYPESGSVTPPPPPPPYRPLPPSAHPTGQFTEFPTAAPGGVVDHAGIYQTPDSKDHVQFNIQNNSEQRETQVGPQQQQQQFFRAGLLRPSLYGLSSMNGTRIMISNPLSVPGSRSKLLTTVSSWTVHCCAQVLPHNVICNSQMTGTTMAATAKVDDPPGVGIGSAPMGVHLSAPEHSSPNAHPNPIELDPQALWKENQQLRLLLHEATVRLQYVDVLECHLQRLSLLVESMLASHHRQCELDQQLHGCPNSDSFSLDPCSVVPMRPMDMMMMQLLPHSMPANPGSLPSMPTCVPVPHYHPFPGAPPVAPPPVAAVCPLLPPCEHHIAGLPPYHPVWNADLSYHEPHPTQADRAALPRRSMRPTGQAPSWPRTVSLDRADEVSNARPFSGHPDAPVFRGTSGQTEKPLREPATQKRVRVVADDAQLLPTTHRQQQQQLHHSAASVTNLPFRSVQVTRRRFQTPAGRSHPSGIINLCTGVSSRARCTAPVSAPVERSAQPHASGSFGHPGIASSRPIGVSLITKHSSPGDDEAVKMLSPSSELLPVKTAVTSVYHQVASACRVCLADSGDKATQTPTFVAPQLRPDPRLEGTVTGSQAPRTSVETSSSKRDTALVAPVGFSQNHPISHQPPTTLAGVVKTSTSSSVSRVDQVEHVRNSLESEQVMRKPNLTSSHIRVAENDGSGSYEGISPSQSTEFKQRPHLCGGDQTNAVETTSPLGTPTKSSSAQPLGRPVPQSTDRFVSFPLGSPFLDPHSAPQTSRNTNQLKPSPVCDMTVDYPSPQPLTPQLDSPLQGAELGISLGHVGPPSMWFDPVYSNALMTSQYGGGKPSRPVSVPSDNDHYHRWRGPHDVVYLPAMPQSVGHRRLVPGVGQINSEFIPEPVMPVRQIRPRLSSPSSVTQSAGPYGRCPPRSAPHSVVGQRPALQVHFASPPPGLSFPVPTPVSSQQSPSRLGPGERTATQSRNLTLDSIVSPHLLRRQFCFD